MGNQKVTNKIKLKKKNRGKFTEYCEGKVTQECIDKAKKSGNKKLIKRAVFAQNSRSWSKHQEGGIINKYQQGKSIDWDKTLPGQLINMSENADSVGWDGVNRRWYAADKKGYDKNQFGMGVDRNQTPGFKDKVKKDKKGREYLTEADERALRFQAIDAANASAQRRYAYARHQTKSKKPISPKHNAITISAIYNLGSSHVANTIFKNREDLENLFNSNSNAYQDRIHQEYKKRRLFERTKNENKFFKMKGL